MLRWFYQWNQIVCLMIYSIWNLKNVDAQNKILNCLFTNDNQNCSQKIVWTNHFSKNSLLSCSVEYNVHIIFRIDTNINELNAIAMILLTWSNCCFHRELRFDVFKIFDESISRTKFISQNFEFIFSFLQSFHRTII